MRVQWLWSGRRRRASREHLLTFRGPSLSGPNAKQRRPVRLLWCRILHLACVVLCILIGRTLKPSLCIVAF
jgi:hypothetical protein